LGGAEQQRGGSADQFFGASSERTPKEFPGTQSNTNSREPSPMAAHTKNARGFV
jgi:hypothetical protein